MTSTVESMIRKGRHHGQDTTASEQYDERHDDITRVLDWIELEFDKHKTNAKTIRIKTAQRLRRQLADAPRPAK